MQGSKSIKRLQREEQEEKELTKEARKLRKEMKQRGHVIPAKKGIEPRRDVEEKRLQKIATKGVVQLFNAINAAQKRIQSEDASGNKAKIARLGKASFLAEIQHMKNSEKQADRSGIQASSDVAVKDVAEEHDQGWDVLKKGFVGVQENAKMKDWDKAKDSDNDQLQSAGEGSSSDDDGW